MHYIGRHIINYLSLIIMEPSIQTLYTMTKIASKAYTQLNNAFGKRQKRRLQEFSQYFEITYERMTDGDKQKLNQFIESDEGEELLADYAESILKISSSRVMMAMALLYCNQTEFTAIEKATLIIASKSLNNDLVDFYLKTHSQEKYKNDNLPYFRCSFSTSDCDSFTNEEWDEETVAIYIDELIKLRLLLPDPLTHSVYAGSDDSWSIYYGISNKTQKIVNLLVKSEALLTN